MSVFDSTLSANKEVFLQLVDKLNSDEWIMRLLNHASGIDSETEALASTVDIPNSPT